MHFQNAEGQINVYVRLYFARHSSVQYFRGKSAYVLNQYGQLVIFGLARIISMTITGVKSICEHYKKV